MSGPWMALTVALAVGFGLAAIVGPSCFIYWLIYRSERDGREDRKRDRGTT